MISDLHRGVIFCGTSKQASIFWSQFHLFNNDMCEKAPAPVYEVEYDILLVFGCDLYMISITTCDDLWMTCFNIPLDK